LPKRIQEARHPYCLYTGIIPYVDPNRFRRNNDQCSYKKSDIYSLGVLLWEISSGHPPFHGESHDFGLIDEILRGLREKPVSDTPKDYVKIYTGK